MSDKPSLFKVNHADSQTNNMDEVDFSVLGLRERQDIQEWIEKNPDILGQNLLIIAKEFSKFEQTRVRPDLLAVAPDGQLVVIELKRDDTGEDAHWQAIKYASCFHAIDSSDIVEMFAHYRDITIDKARQNLTKYTDSDEELERLNESQRIILASHRFAPLVTSAALWLNEQSGRDLVTCVQITPYRDRESDALYLLSNTIIPVPGAEMYFIGLRNWAEARGDSEENINLRRRMR